MDQVIEELQSRWRDMLAALARGEDVPPSKALRAEGMMEAVALAGAASGEELDRLLERCFEECTGTSLTSALGEDWRAFHPFPQLPLWMHRAPVYPSTKD